MRYKSLLYTFLFFSGVFLGCFFTFHIFPKILKIRDHKDAKNNIGKNLFESIDETNLYNAIDNQKYSCDLCIRKYNLFIFWSPTCPACKKILNQYFNDEIIGVYGVPLTKDMDYLCYICKKNNVDYPQLICINNNEYSSLKMEEIQLIPQFWIVDNKGIVIDVFIGINEMDNIYKYLNSIPL